MSEVMLNLGSGYIPWLDWVNVDNSAHVAADVYHDLRLFPWPWQDASVSKIRAIDILEHMPDTVAFIDECWRVLRPDSVLMIRVPHWQDKTAWLDPTHVRAFHQETFDYFDPAMKRGEKYGMYTPRKWAVETRRVGGNIETVMRKQV